MFCKGRSAAFKRYRRDVMRIMACYAVVLFCSSWFVKHDGGEPFFLYFWSVLPSIPIIGVIWRMGRYLSEEKDEYQRLMMMYAVLGGTAALLAVALVNDFLRGFAKAPGLPAFWDFLIFCIGMGATQAWHKFRNRLPADDAQEFEG